MIYRKKKRSLAVYILLYGIFFCNLISIILIIVQNKNRLFLPLISINQQLGWYWMELYGFWVGLLYNLWENFNMEYYFRNSELLEIIQTSSKINIPNI